VTLSLRPVISKTENQSLFGGLEHEFLFSIYWEESSQVTFIFFRGVETTNKITIVD
jgi:hypothetical protein